MLRAAININLGFHNVNSVAYAHISDQRRLSPALSNTEIEPNN